MVFIVGVASVLFYFMLDLMQGVNPFEAFLSLPRSLQGMDELDEGILPIPESAQSNENAWSLEKEEVRDSLYLVLVLHKEGFYYLSMEGGSTVFNVSMDMDCVDLWRPSTVL